MKRTAKKIIVAATIAAVSLQSAPVALACGGSGSRIARPAGSYGHSARIYRQPAPTYHRSAYSQPSYSQPSYGQPAYRGQVYNQPVRPVQPAPVAAVQPRPRAQVAFQTAATTQQAVPQRVATRPAVSQTSVRPQAVAQQALTQPTARPQSVTQAPAARQAVTQPVASTTPASTADAETSALAALAAIATAQPAAATQPAPAPQPAAAQPAAVQPAVPQFSTPPAAASNKTAPHIGSFQASLPSNVTIKLSLSNSGTFSWVVRNNGKTTQFSGQYRMTDGRLTLVRSNDLQQMAGKLTSAQTGFTFKLDGASNGGLNFKRV